MQSINKPGRSSGFTVIEIMIVLAIAGLILAIILLAIPNAKRIERNHSRKQFVNFISTQLDTYKGDTQLTYPATDAEKCLFMTKYLTKYTGPSPACTFDAAKDCMFVHGYLYDVCFHEAPSSEHSYLGEPDEISIQTGHWCNVAPSRDQEPVGNPITNGVAGNDFNVQLYVVWDSLESSPLYCVSNF
ncbi:MAG: prepilin-type N-terminal cleavage/methylation domain-containing protein [Candidatus Saccharimonadales bacterium]